MISNTDFKPIADLDLDPIKVKLMHKESGEGWTLDYANQVEFEYRRFLYLMKMFPNVQAAPMFDVDIFWHYHILDTMKYAVDCDEVFGYFLHHFPYVGLRGEDDEAAHRRFGEHMQQLYEDTFGEPYLREAQQSAFSMAAGTDASHPTKTPWSTDAVTTAWSMVAGAAHTPDRHASPAIQTAWSADAVKTAWSMTPGAARTPDGLAAPGIATAWSADAVKTAWSMTLDATRTVDRFYSERPRLAAA